MRKINFKQPKYILPLVAFLPIVFLIYNVSSIFGGDTTAQNGVVTDSINMSLPDADAQQMDGKLSEMEKAEWDDDAYTAVYGLDPEGEQRDSVSHGYSEAELDQIDRYNAERLREAKERAELERSLNESRKHYDSYRNSSTASSSRSQYSEMEEYAKALEEIQNLNRRRNQNNSSGYIDSEIAEHPQMLSTPQEKSVEKKDEPKPEIVYKTPEKGADRFHTLVHKSAPDAALIKAIIDKTTKARNGTRLRFKLLDDVTIKGTLLKKGTYLYGVVSGFGGQRVMASITSILIKDKLVKVDLSVYDNDGMEGFYVPESLFRNFVKDAGSGAVSNGININNNTSSELSAETMALQALQNVYTSASNAVSNNIRQDKARIKYNTIVYLINTSQDNN